VDLAVHQRQGFADFGALALGQRMQEGIPLRARSIGATQQFVVTAFEGGIAGEQTSPL
jgi:hypothetical protein